MKTIGCCILFTICLVMAAAEAAAQPNWVKQAVQDASSLTVPDETEAVILRDIAELTVRSDGRTLMHIRQAYKILTASGKGYGRLSEPISPYRVIKKLKGWTITSDGRTRKLSKETLN